MQTYDQLKKSLEYMSITDVEEKMKRAKQGLPYAYVEEVAADALAHFWQMETENHQLLAKIKQLEAELHDIKKAAIAADALCDICKHNGENEVYCEVHDLLCSECSAKCACKECYPNDCHYEWRGVQKEETK